MGSYATRPVGITHCGGSPMSGHRIDREELLFAKEDLRSWLQERRRLAIDEVRNVHPDEILSRPHEQIVEEVLDRYLVSKPRLIADQVTGEVDDQHVDVSGDFRRAISDHAGPTYVDGTRITLHIPYDGPAEALRLRASTFTLNPPRAIIGDGRLSISRDVPADRLEQDREHVVQDLRDEIQQIQEHLRHAEADIAASNDQMQDEVHRAAEARRRKVLTDRDTEAILGVPLHRDEDVARSYRVQPVKRKRITPAQRTGGRDAFSPEPAITDEDFAAIIGDIVSVTRSFERLAVTYADMDEERLRDQILAMLGNVYGPTTGESFSKRGKSDIYLPWEGGNPVFLAECKWWTGPKAFAERDLPQLLDRYVVWRDTHAAVVLFIRNKDATKVVTTAEESIRAHGRFVRDGPPIDDVPVFVLHKEGDPDREIKLALVAVVIHS